MIIKHRVEISANRLLVLCICICGSIENCSIERSTYAALQLRLEALPPQQITTIHMGHIPLIASLVNDIKSVNLRSTPFLEYTFAPVVAGIAKNKLGGIRFRWI